MARARASWALFAVCAVGVLVHPARGGFPLGWRNNNKPTPTKKELSELERTARERLNTYETALQIQHRKLLELRHKNRELERVCANLLNVILFSIVWPRVARFVSARTSRRSRSALARRTTFADVAGCNEAKRELQEVVEFLKHPKKFRLAGARVPKGVIMEGAPGVGKTMLARAVAGEAGVSFIDTSGSALGSTIYVGVGASKVRALFAEARRKRPCIVFIDEIDALGGRRDASNSGGSQESARTLNQLLTEMDGFSGETGVVVMAATNRADVLDPALLRAGRFDRRVPIQLPNIDERTEILKVHAKGKHLGKEVDLGSIARRTSGFSGAELATLLNEAAIATACSNATVISSTEVDFALDKLQIGLRRPSHAAAKVRECVAVHEAGHACAALLSEYDNVSKVTILPRSNGVGGFTAFSNAAADEEGGLPTRERLLKELQVLLGGRVAEELALGRERVTVGASDDLRRAQELALAMVTRYGMAEDEFGLSVSGRSDPGHGAHVPEAVGKRVSKYVERLIAKSHARCRALLKADWKLVLSMRDVLLEKETIAEPEIAELLAEHRKDSASRWRLMAWPSAFALLPAPAEGAVSVDGDVRDAGAVPVAACTPRQEPSSKTTAGASR